MRALFLIIGLFVGVFQVLLTGILSDCITHGVKKVSKLALLIAAKLILYAAAVVLIMLTLRELLFIAAGYGAGMVAGCTAFIIFKLVFASRASKEKTFEAETAERR